MKSFREVLFQTTVSRNDWQVTDYLSQTLWKTTVKWDRQWFACKIFLAQCVKMSERKWSNVANRSLNVANLVKWIPGVCDCVYVNEFMHWGMGGLKVFRSLTAWGIKLWWCVLYCDVTCQTTGGQTVYKRGGESPLLCWRPVANILSIDILEGAETNPWAAYLSCSRYTLQGYRRRWLTRFSL